MLEASVAATDAMAAGRAALRSLRLPEAVAAFRAVPDTAADAFEAHLGLSRALTRMRQQDEARAEAQRCIDLAPDRAEGYAALGVLQFLTDELAGARESLRRAESLDPADPEAALALAQVEADERRTDEARAALQRGRQAIATLPEAVRAEAEAMAWHVDTYLRMAENDTEGATNAAQEVLARRDANPYAACLALSNLGILAAKARRYDEAIGYLEQAYALNPYFYRAGSALGRLLLVRRRHERAAQVLEDVVARSPSAGGDTRYALAFALGKMGRRSEAHAAYGDALAHGIGGSSRLLALWQRVWLSEMGRYAVIGLLLTGLLAWVVLGKPSAQTMTLFAVLAVILLLQRLIKR